MKKTILLTGATDGIGLATAHALAERGHTLLLHGRNSSKVQSLCESLASKTSTFGFVADLSSIAATKQFTQEVSDQFEHIDVIINNAGVLKTPEPITVDKLDVRFAVNTVASYLITTALLKKLNQHSRVISLSSAAQAHVDLNALVGKVFIDQAFEAYAQSKLAILMWNNHLASLYPNGPQFIALNPGSLLASKMVKEGFGMAGKDINIGVRSMLKTALADELTGKTGVYFDNDIGKISAPHVDASNPARCAELVSTLDSLLSKH